MAHVFQATMPRKKGKKEISLSGERGSDHVMCASPSSCLNSSCPTDGFSCCARRIKSALWAISNYSRTRCREQGINWYAGRSRLSRSGGKTEWSHQIVCNLALMKIKRDKSRKSCWCRVRLSLSDSHLLSATWMFWISPWLCWLLLT